MTRTRWLALGALVVAAGSAWWIFAGRAPAVRTTFPARGTAAEIVYATGNVEPVTWAKVASIVRGRVVEICHCESKSVDKGEILARLDDREARAVLSELQARHKFAVTELDRVTQLAGRGVATPQALQKATTDLAQIEALIRVQHAKLGDYEVRAPLAGVVLRRDGEIGEIVDPGQVLFRVGVPAKKQVVAEVNEEDIPRVKLGQPVLFRTDAFPDRELSGTVSEITPMGDPVSKTYRIKIALPDDTPLLTGMSVEANVVTRRKEGALIVPAAAVIGDEVQVIEDGRARRRKVVVGIRGTRTVEIVSGLETTNRIAAPAVDSVRDGARIRVESTPLPKPARGG
ncbi:MAG: efflux RND transporter periplasmic adaptor subunit [Burkholderiaceae bacterium]